MNGTKEIWRWEIYGVMDGYGVWACVGWSYVGSVRLLSGQCLSGMRVIAGSSTKLDAGFRTARWRWAYRASPLKKFEACLIDCFLPLY